MKAIILAGGEGTRLRPLTEECPKPMIKLVDRPVLEHIVLLLKKAGITDICMTLGYLPEVVTNYFGDGHSFGVSIKYNIEQTPLGTAGGTAACREFIGKDDFCVISGDCVCDFDLTECFAYHRQKKADVTLVLSKNEKPLEFGVVLTKADGTVEGFAEKPDWENVESDLVNTGIYIISNSVLDTIPKNVMYDFSRDLFPKLMVNKKRLFGFETSGYWCDIGNCESYLKCVYDALEGNVKIEFKANEILPGVWSETELEGKKIKIMPPVYVGKNVKIENDVSIGPNTVIGSGSVIKSNTDIKNSVIDGAFIGECTRIDGAIICPDSVIGDNASIAEGAVVGNKTVIGSGSRILRGVKIWPEREIEPESHISESVIKGNLRGRMSFVSRGTIAGEINITVSAEECVAIGGASAYVGRVSAGWSGGDGARILAESFGSGVCSAGAEFIYFGECFAAAAAYIGKSMAVPLTVFFEQHSDNVKITFFDGEGNLIPRDVQRKIEQLAASGYNIAAATEVGESTNISAVSHIYASVAAKKSVICGEKCKVKAVVLGEGPATISFAYALKLIGGQVLGNGENLPQFKFDEDGFGIEAIDEKGRKLNREQLTVAAAMTEFDRGETIVHADRYAPQALDVLAKSYGGEIMRDGYKNEVLHDAVFMAVRICSSIAAKHERLSDMADRIPEFAISTREVSIKNERGYVMKNLRYSKFETGLNEPIGFAVSSGRGFVRVMPSSVRRAVIISSEANNAEIAEELCGDFEKLIKNVDKNGNNNGK